MKKLFRKLVLLVLMVTIALTIFVSLRSPSLHRDWDEDVRILAGVDNSNEDKITLTSIRDWQYDIGSIRSKSYFDATFNPDDIVEMWMYEQEIGLAGLIAHTFIVFEFNETYNQGRYLGLSVETRRERGESYSIVGGALRAFEITHVWATEQDLITRRVQFLDYPLTRYRMNIPAAYRSQIFREFVKETKDLASSPVWYNTVSNNCTSSLIKYVNQSESGAIPLHYSYALTGKVDDYLTELGYKDPDYSLSITRDFLRSNSLR